ncbi:Fur family transcriptional regulator Irr [Bradyrhizobium liaoningense]|uniref:Fur family transcriptional regulator Irr n=1 Tax=Bradyrhizobium liaoningense TaxID=43992 RepID=UPI001BA51893|nr:Fur family transcriptional regulator [Bradyrhizobium liaoningense]MBR0853390.1 transcriptional repressor [Bradyrhizobium liaoningense]
MDIQAANTTPVDDDRGADLVGPDVVGPDLPPDDCVQRCLQLLSDAGLRPTRQRLALGQLLFLRGHRHVTAERLYEEAITANMNLSLATVYNTLNQFTEAGLLRRIAADGIKSFFDTDTSVHPHFYLEGEDVLVDVADGLAFSKVPEALPGHEIARLDVIVHLRRKRVM